jgi:hypothetical protein
METAADVGLNKHGVNQKKAKVTTNTGEAVNNLPVLSLKQQK